MTSNTGAKQANKGQFTKGDQRINRKGRPKSFDALRALAQQISHEVLTAQDGTSRTVAEAILRKLATENPERFLEIAFGKVPQPVDITSGGEKIKGYAVISPDVWNEENQDPAERNSDL